MNLLSIFRRRPPIRDSADLAQFIDENAAFLVQKGIYEYSRARAGRYSKVLFQEPAFIEAVEKSRWQAFPLGLSLVAELVDSVLQPPGASERRRELERLNTLVLSVFDKYPVPASLGDQSWTEARAELDRRLEMIGMHGPKRAMDIPEPWAETYFNFMPIHEKLRGRDFPAVRNYLRVVLCNMHEELTKRMDVKAMTDMLTA
jgi:hypothetical protein